MQHFSSSSASSSCSSVTTANLLPPSHPIPRILFYDTNITPVFLYYIHESFMGSCFSRPAWQPHLHHPSSSWVKCHDSSRALLQRVTGPTFFLYVQATGSNNYKKNIFQYLLTDWNKGRLCVRRRHHQTEKNEPCGCSCFLLSQTNISKKALVFQTIKSSLTATFPLRFPFTQRLSLLTAPDANRASEDTAVESCDIPLHDLI